MLLVFILTFLSLVCFDVFIMANPLHECKGFLREFDLFYFDQINDVGVTFAVWHATCCND
jgi:hypothetical protein